MITVQAITAALVGLGGLSLFLFGMAQLSKGLQSASGQKFRNWMRAIAKNRFKGFSLGLTMGTTVQSSATTVMAVGLLNAGLLTLKGAIPVIAGANLGTTLSMQFIAFDISWLWAAMAIVGGLLYMLDPRSKRGRIGRAFIGLALLFLGMRLMKESVYPFRDTLSQWIANHNGSDWPAFIVSFLGATFFTALIQSSGAAVGILFALSTAGVLTSIEQAFPLIIGAQIGTCITALLASTGTSADARRGAIGHLLFNIITAAVSIILMPFIIKATDFDIFTLSRQIANVHTLSMLAGCILVIPLLQPFVWMLRLLTPFKSNTQEQSFLDYDLLDTPKLAVQACRNELGRTTRIIRRGFYMNRLLLKHPDKRTYMLVKQAERNVNDIYWATRRYMMKITKRTTTNEDTGRMQWMNLCLNYLERIGDHNDNLADLMLEIHKRIHPDDLQFTIEICDVLCNSVEPILTDIQDAWAGQEADGRAHAGTIKNHRTDYLTESDEQQSRLVENIASGSIMPLTGFILTEYISEMDRIVRHAKKIASILKKTSAKAA